MEDRVRIRYIFTLRNGARETFDLAFDASSFDLQGHVPVSPPEWTRLEYQQCPNCPLHAASHPHCPAALRLADLAGRFEPIVSYDDVRVEVETEERTITRETSAQQALSSLMGLIMATSGCPHTAFFKPMARFHLPLASEEETTFRSVATYLMLQFFRHRRGLPADIELSGLKRVYENLRQVNSFMAKRLRSAGRTDSTLNAVVLLDVFTIVVPAAVEDSLADIRLMLQPLLEGLDHTAADGGAGAVASGDG